ncbi:putative had-superfamily hydrolase subfamily iib [Phaeomoniella chlamydospora]|uniref:Putative had-superfamily hydrolase subfamily iib n=1 Tax=Phaeomoniella chlamydospora TaxID=158046 RepID=A0A0G2DVP7_PHACM|nr:putative had-superfamily hydrolase subfamily iib [Phaeomoniella chlamydospora]
MQIIGPSEENDVKHQTIEKLLDENAELNAQLAASKNDLQTIQTALNGFDEIVIDLTTTKDELEETKQECLSLRQERETLLAQLEEQQKMFQEKEKEFQDQIAVLQKALAKPVTPRKPLWLLSKSDESRQVVNNKQSTENFSQEINNLNKQVQDLQDLVDAKDSALGHMEDGKRKAEQEAIRLGNELTMIRQVNLNSDASIASRTAELESSRKVSNHFMATSEQLSRENRELATQNRALEEFITSKDLELRDKEILCQALYEDIFRLQSSHSEPRNVNSDTSTFDLDGTLAESKQPLKESMGEALADLLSVANVAVISGGDWLQFKKQVASRLPTRADLSRLWLMPTTGTKLYTHKNGEWQAVYTELFSDTERKNILEAFEASLEATGFKPEKTWGNRIEDRGSQITFSALGQEAPISEKEHWDPNFVKRKVIQADLRKRLPELSINMGGATSIDITQKGVDKGYGLKKLCDASGIPLSSMIFIGDAIFPGGNDYPAKELGLDTVRVKDPDGTLAAIAGIVACLK